MSLRNFFYLRSNDRRGLFIVVILSIIAIIGIVFLGNNVKSTAAFDNDSTQRASLSQQTYNTPRHSFYPQTSSHNIQYSTPNNQHSAPFPFDPNTADSTQLLRLGLAPWQVRSIYKYRAKGGVFHTPDEFAKIYGLTQKQFNQLKPYIRISDDYQPARYMTNGYHRYNPYDPQDRDTLLYPIKLKPNEKIILNTADTTTLKKVPGIGSGWARKIKAYGDYLGGYVSVDQLRDLEGFPEELMEYFIVKNPTPRKIKINELTLSQLRKHPYINFYQARAITDYRRMNGRLESLNQLKLLKDFPEEAIKRLEPYVEY